jgi:hypothetical protein
MVGPHTHRIIKARKIAGTKPWTGPFHEFDKIVQWTFYWTKFLITSLSLNSIMYQL